MDLTISTEAGILNIRAAAIIRKNDSVLMTRDEGADFCYPVGGRVRMGETSEAAVRREVREETGVELAVDRLGFVHENFFAEQGSGKRFHEIAFYYYMDVPQDFEPLNMEFGDNGRRHFLEWVPIAGERKLFPMFFRTELDRPSADVRHMVTIE